MLYYLVYFNKKLGIIQAWKCYDETAAKTHRDILPGSVAMKTETNDEVKAKNDIFAHYTKAGFTVKFPVGVLYG
jgi:hypothetical protein